MNANSFVSIDLPLGSDSLSSEETKTFKSLPPHGHCCEASKLVETTRESRRVHTGVRAHVTDMETLPNRNDGERRREKVKRFVAEKGPRIAGAATAIGMFIFNVVTSCA